MLYNYNAYSVQKLEYSLDGTNYTEVARITLPGAKAWTPLEATLPESCNNAESLYLRWIPDYSSEIVGTASENDGTAIGSIYTPEYKKELIREEHPYYSLLSPQTMLRRFLLQDVSY